MNKFLLVLALPLCTFLESDVCPGVTAAGPPERKEHKKTGKHKTPEVPPPSTSAVEVPKGYHVQIVLKNLTYPSSVELDDAGNLYVAEAGYSYGDPKAKPRVIRQMLSGEPDTLLTDGLEGPVMDLLWHKGRLYISHRGKISAWSQKEGLRDLVTGLPSEGDHHNNQMCIGPDGKLYFGQGTATNSGVVGVDNYRMGWLKKHPEFHDRPARDIVLAGESFKTSNPLADKDDNAVTSAFHPFGKIATGSAVVKGTTKASGTILRMDLDGTNLEVYAWGFRNPTGLALSPDRKLYASENGFDVRGSRPIANDQEDLYLVKQGAWYGWPDYASGVPVTDPKFMPPKGPAPQFLMKDHPPVEKPLMTFPKHAAITQMDFCTSKSFGREGKLFVAFFGHMTPMTGKPPDKHGGHRVACVDLQTGKVETFFGRKDHHHGERKTYGEEKKEAKDSEKGHHMKEGGATAGPRRLVDVRFSPKWDALYIVDFGAMFVTPEGPQPVRETGLIWRVIRDDAKLPILLP